MHQGIERIVKYAGAKIRNLLLRLIPTEIYEIELEAYKRGAKVGRNDGYAKGKAAGKETGHSEGYEKGWQDGIAKGETIYRIVDERTKFDPKEVDDALYGPEVFDVTDTREQDMRRDVEVAVNKNIIGEPTPAQWEMILASHPATCVSAGAGSGKSTTLVLRIVFMVQYLGVPLDSITVVSFTRASCRDLREKLARVLGYWQKREIPTESLLRTVSTFHSVLYHLTTGVRPAGELFEFLEDTSTPEDEEAEDEIEVENPGISTKLKPDQQQLLEEAYRVAFSSDVDFRAHVVRLLACELSIRRLGRPEWMPGAYFMAAQRERPLLQEMHKIWTDNGWPIRGVTPGPIEAFQVNNHKFFADGQIGTNGPLVVLGLPADKKIDLKIIAPKTDSAPLQFALTARIRIFAAYCESQVIIVRNKDDLRLLEILIKQREASLGAGDPEDPPKFSVKVPGENKAVALTESLYQQGSFITSLGREVPDLLRTLPAPKHANDYEYTYATVLGLFWPTFERVLREKEITTFDRVFMLATQNADTMAFHSPLHRRMQHLLIDEFQDISPLVADWLIAMQSQLVKDGSPVSAMAIGDDWQSIYGWRGSSPDLFIRFPDYFRSHGHIGAAPQIKLDINFRSIPDIVKHASKLIDHVSRKDKKICVANSKTRKTDHGLRIKSYKDISPKENELIERLQKFILVQYEESLEFEKASTEHVLVMARTNNFLKKVKKGMPEKRGLTFRTYHRAKGLEADIAIMLEDCRAGSSHPFRNAVYKASSRFPEGYTYDRAKEDETYRLAYVGVTRGRRRVHWFVKDRAKAYAAAVYGNFGP